MTELGPFGRIVKQHTPARATITVDVLTVEWGAAFVDVLYNRVRDVYLVDLAGVLIDVGLAEQFLGTVVEQLEAMRATGRTTGLVPPEAGI